MIPRLVIALLAIALALPALTALPGAPPADETLVEGHTVYALAQLDPEAGYVPHSLAEGFQATALLALPVGQGDAGHGVRWFNDQDLLAPSVGSAPDDFHFAVAVLARESNWGDEHLPCTGAVLAVNAGAPDPRAALSPDNYDGPQPTYVESYLVTDPNDHQWNVDKWRVPGPTGDYTAWTVAVNNYDAGYELPDNYADECPAITDEAPAPTRGTNGLYYPDGVTKRGHIRYNALLVLPLDELTVDQGARNHAAADNWGRAMAVSGCEDSCFFGSNGIEGNSHDFNPLVKRFPGWFATREDGGSADCDGDAQPDEWCHATRRIDLYYGPVTAPILRSYTIVDTEGSSADY
jgi:hypothetical protein